MVSARDLLQASDFQLTLREGDPDLGYAGQWTIWGQGDIRGFDRRPRNDLSIDGRVLSAYLGVDYRFHPDALFGFAVSFAGSSIDYGGDLAGDSKISARLANLYPYAHWSPHERLSTWVMFGVGKGNLEIEYEDDDEGDNTGISMLMVAVGARGELLSAGAFDFALKTDVFGVRVKSDAIRGRLQSVEGDAGRVRLAFEGRARDLLVGEQERLSPVLEVGGRFDDGDSEEGFGVDIGVGVEYENYLRGVRLGARWRLLVAHEESGFGEWGLNLTALVKQKEVDGRGARVSVESSWGADSDSKADELWDREEVLKSGDYEGEEVSLDSADVVAEFGYGVGLSGGLLTPFAKVGVEGSGSHSAGVGARMSMLGGKLNGLSVELLGEQSKSRREKPDYRLGLKGAIKF